MQPGGVVHLRLARLAGVKFQVVPPRRAGWGDQAPDEVISPEVRDVELSSCRWAGPGRSDQILPRPAASADGQRGTVRRQFTSSLRSSMFCPRHWLRLRPSRLRHGATARARHVESSQVQEEGPGRGGPSQTSKLQQWGSSRLLGWRGLKLTWTWTGRYPGEQEGHTSDGPLRVCDWQSGAIEVGRQACRLEDQKSSRSLLGSVEEAARVLSRLLELRGACHAIDLPC
ncbi:hypothetical protein B0T11DRAFT_13943 [Plectosphaerella cucumerina]|uniref:Uncharacterized protein n=1 Tax=Plectosphaerella cucumerina TaxID=40658 RepID=A0A8K0X8Y9_9PEZI|nr:hypothetical protein B0T11DRAFT_13943 [Plectosphaerella cucumerina]